MISYQVQSEKGFTGKVGELVWMLEHTRAITIQEVADLSTEELDWSMEGGNSIGALLSHIAAVEYVHQLISFEQRDMDESERKEWGAALELGEKAKQHVHGMSIDDLLDVLEATRDQTLDYLKGKNDDWLYKEDVWSNGVTFNHYYLWFHVLEDEINHRGQIRALIRSMKEKKVSS
ncbi:DinB family protein [Halobacillus sp. ACCC02827]|uniref:DinB family protein n=1 Tax=Bacillaceae TaxID=186817 RepID=UPI0003FB7A9B|nr:MULTISPECIES: DinB family protein [Bacillaceae]QHT46943.1 DinB family protein [Bacillus sp. SB49]WJE14168.1 DinB family protein [Halobacillus sp. ACCC02827]